MSACTSPWYAGLTCDHLYADCPNRKRGEAELRRYGWWYEGPSPVDPHDAAEELCGMCVHRHNRSEHKGAA